MSKIGFILYLDLEKKKASAKITILDTKAYISSVGEDKFSLFIKTNAAAASKPTTAGRSPLNTAVTAG